MPVTLGSPERRNLGCGSLSGQRTFERERLLAVLRSRIVLGQCAEPWRRTSRMAWVCS